MSQFAMESSLHSFEGTDVVKPLIDGGGLVVCYE